MEPKTVNQMTVRFAAPIAKKSVVVHVRSSTIEHTLAGLKQVGL
jgi:hypothetical protein